MSEPKRWKKLPAVEGSVACLTCGAGAKSDIDLNCWIAVGFGAAGYSRDGDTLWEESETEEIRSVAYVEQLALEDPDHDWRIFFHAPLYSAEYQRQGEGLWVLVSKDEGFA